MSTGVLKIKLYELEQNYEKMEGRLHLCQNSDKSKLTRELQQLKDEYEEKNFLLKKSAEHSRSPAVTALSAEQMKFFKNAENIIKTKLPLYMQSEEAYTDETKAEASALYAEYAVDFAVQAMRYALISSMEAIIAQLESENKKEE